MFRLGSLSSLERRSENRKPIAMIFRLCHTIGNSSFGFQFHYLVTSDLLGREFRAIRQHCLIRLNFERITEIQCLLLLGSVCLASLRHCRTPFMALHSPASPYSIVNDLTTMGNTGNMHAKMQNAVITCATMN